MFGDVIGMLRVVIGARLLLVVARLDL